MYQDLQNHIMEMQLELNATRIDRDGMAVELQTARETIHSLHLTNHQQQSNAAMSLENGSSDNNSHHSKSSVNHHNAVNTTSSSSADPREVQNLKEVIGRKDEIIERLQEECQQENILRLSNEDSANSKISELLISLDESKR